MPQLNVLFYHHDKEIQELLESLFEDTDLVRMVRTSTPGEIPALLKEGDFQVVILALSSSQLDEGQFIYNLVNKHRLLQVILIAPLVSLTSLINSRELGADDVIFKSPELRENLEESLKGCYQKLLRWNDALSDYFNKE
ncbi:hypothetical protein ACFL35_12960 [Candidatus Riflebacteria bacterium]